MGVIRRELRAARIRQGLKLADAAQLAGVQPETWAKWELGARTPTLQTAMKVAKAFGVPAEILWSDMALHSEVD